MHKGDIVMTKHIEIAKSIASTRLLIKKKYAILSGGTEINRKDSPVKGKNFVSISKLDLKTIEVVDGSEYDMAKKCIRIGTLCTFTQLLESADVPEDLKVALRFCKSFQKRNQATIGGNIAASRDDSYLIPTLAAMNAHLVISGEKNCEYILDYISGKHSDRLIEYILLPSCRRRVVSYRVANTESSHATLTMAFGLCEHDGKFKKPKIVAAVKKKGIIEFQKTEKLIESNNSFDLPLLINSIKKETPRLKDDVLYGSAEYRMYLINATMEILKDEMLKKMEDLKDEN